MNRPVFLIYFNIRFILAECYSTFLQFLWYILRSVIIDRGAARSSTIQSEMDPIVKIFSAQFKSFIIFAKLFKKMVRGFSILPQDTVF